MYSAQYCVCQWHSSIMIVKRSLNSAVSWWHFNSYMSLYHKMTTLLPSICNVAWMLLVNGSMFGCWSQRLSIALFTWCIGSCRPLFPMFAKLPYWNYRLSWIVLIWEYRAMIHLSFSPHVSNIVFKASRRAKLILKCSMSWHQLLTLIVLNLYNNLSLSLLGIQRRVKADLAFCNKLLHNLVDESSKEFIFLEKFACVVTSSN